MRITGRGKGHSQRPLNIVLAGVVKVEERAREHAPAGVGVHNSLINAKLQVLSKTIITKPKTATADLLTVTQAAIRLKVSRQNIHDAIGRGASAPD